MRIWSITKSEFTNLLPIFTISCTTYSTQAIIPFPTFFKRGNLCILKAERENYIEKTCQLLRIVSDNETSDREDSDREDSDDSEWEGDEGDDIQYAGQRQEP